MAASLALAATGRHSQPRSPSFRRTAVLRLQVSRLGTARVVGLARSRQLTAGSLFDNAW